MGHLWLTLVLVVSFVVVGLIWRRWRALASREQAQRAMAQFEDRLHEMSEQFLHAAAATGKPRGLRWTSVELAGPPLFVTDSSSGALCAFVGATISFEAVEGGD